MPVLFLFNKERRRRRKKKGERRRKERKAKRKKKKKKIKYFISFVSVPEFMDVRHMCASAQGEQKRRSDPKRKVQVA